MNVESEIFLEEFEMVFEKFRQEILSGNWRSNVICRVVGELIQEEYKEEILSYWCAEEKFPNESSASVGNEAKLLYYIVTSKRFLEICVNSDSFSSKFYLLKSLNSFQETVVPHQNENCAFENSSYFSNGTEGVSSYTVEFSFSVAEGESNIKEFSISTSESWNDKRLQKLRDFVQGFHKAVPGL